MRTTSSSARNAGYELPATCNTCAARSDGLPVKTVYHRVAGDGYGRYEQVPWRCKGCGVSMAHLDQYNLGPTREYCCGACKQRAYRRRKKASDGAV